MTVVEPTSRARPGDRPAVGHPIRRALHERMRLDVRADLVDGEVRALEGLVELALGALPGLGQDHLAARERVDLGVALDLERCVEQVGILADDAGHGADAHRVGHARVRRQLADHVGLLAEVGPQRLADQHVALTTVEAAVEVGRGQAPELELLRHLVREISQRVAQAGHEAAVELLHDAAGAELDPGAPLEAGVVLEFLQPEPQEVVHPDRHRRGIHLGAFGLQPMMDVVVGRALDGLEIELAGDLHDRLGPQTIHLDRREATVDLAQRLREVRRRQMPGQRGPGAARRPPAKDLVEVLDALLDDGVGAPGHDLVGTDLVLEVLHQVRAEDRPQAAERDRQVEVEAVAHHGLLVEVVLGQEEHPEGVEARVAQRQLVALVVLAEAAGAARPGRQVDVALRHFLGADALGFAAEEVDEVARREAGRAALADVGHLAPGQEILLGGDGQDARLISALLEHRLENALGAPVQAAEQNRHRVALTPGEGAGRVRAVRLSDDCGHSFLRCHVDSSRLRAAARWRIRAGAGSSRRPSGSRSARPRPRRGTAP